MVVIMSNVINAAEIFRQIKVFNIFERTPIKELFNLKVRIENNLPLDSYPKGTFNKKDLKLLDEIIQIKIKPPK